MTDFEAILNNDTSEEEPTLDTEGSGEDLYIDSSGNGIPQNDQINLLASEYLLLLEELQIARSRYSDIKHSFMYRFIQELRRLFSRRVFTAGRNVLSILYRWSVYRYKLEKIRKTYIKPSDSIDETCAELEVLYQREGVKAALEFVNLHRGVTREELSKLWYKFYELMQKSNHGRSFQFLKLSFFTFPTIEVAMQIIARLNRSGQYSSAKSVLAYVLAKRALNFKSRKEWATVVSMISKLKMINGDYPIPPRTNQSQYSPEPRKVIFSLHNSLPINSGGYATRSHGIVSGLKGRGYNPAVFTRLGYPWDRNDVVESYPEQSFTTLVEGIPYSRIYDPDIKLGKVPTDHFLQAYTKYIEDNARIQKACAIHAASNFYTGLPSVIAARRVGIPSIYEVRGLWEITRMSREPRFASTEHFQLYVAMETLTANSADAVLTLTTSMKQELVSRGVAEERIFVAPNCVDPRKFVATKRDRNLGKQLEIPEDRFVLGFIGTFAQYEGLDDLVKACHILHAQNRTNFHCLMVGDGAEYDRVRELVTERELSDYFTFTGRVPHDSIQRYYSLIDLMVYPRKPLPVCEMVSPLKPFEAMAMTKPILVSSVGALSEFIRNGENGFVFEKGNITYLVSALEKLAHERERCVSVGVQAREWVLENRTWDKTIDIIESVYAALGIRSS